MAERLGVNEFPSCHGGLENLDQEFDYMIDSVEGDVPNDLQGTFFRNGPGRQRIGDTKYGHWFDGDGMIDMNEFTEMMRKTSSEEGKQGGPSFNHRMSQLAKTVLVAHQKKIETSVIGQDMWLIHPLRNTHATWDILISILILLTVVTMPLSLGWEELNEFFFGMNLAVDFIFLLDVCKHVRVLLLKFGAMDTWPT